MIEKGKKYRVWIYFCIFLITLFFVLPQNLLASSLHTLSDKMSRHAPSTPADHEIKFTTPSGIGNAGEYLRIIFDSGFNLSNINYTDIDLFHGPTTGLEIQETLVAAPSLTAWGVNLSGSQINFTHPTNSLNGDIAANHIIIIRIGLNASGGDQQIINPATIGSKVITISGNYGDQGKLAVAIFQDQLVAGGQTLNAPPNPVILYNPYNITQVSMTLEWTKNTDLDFNRYELYYSMNPGVTNTTGTLLATYYNSNQTIYNAIGLSPLTTYYFVVYVYDTETYFAPSNEVSGTTLSGGVVLPPRPGMPTVDDRICPYYVTPNIITGTRPNGSTIYINNSQDNVEYLTNINWRAWVDLVLGDNFFEIYAKDAWGQNSIVLGLFLQRWRVGDTQGDFIVDDFDLAGLAANFWTGWCYADFNEDIYVDDFDLSGLASHWDNVY